MTSPSQIAAAAAALAPAGVASVAMRPSPIQTPIWEVIASNGSRTTYCCTLNQLVQALSY
jgi:hypothetical protein